MIPENQTTEGESQVMKVMRNMFTTEYALNPEDRDLVFRLLNYGENKTGLTEEEMALLRERGLMDKDGLLIIADEFWFRGLVTPSFWLKCLLAFHDLMDFTTFNHSGEEA